MSDLLNNRILRTNQVCELLSISRATLWRWERRGLLPPKRKIGPNTVGWREKEVLEWLASRPSTNETSDGQKGEKP